MKFILWLLVLLFAFTLSYDTISDGVQDIIASNNGTTWAPSAQSAFAAFSYFSRQYRVAREAYAIQIKLFSKETDQGKALFRIATSSERLRDYKVAAKFYRKMLEAFPNHALAGTAKGRLADLESVYLEMVE